MHGQPAASAAGKIERGHSAGLALSSWLVRHGCSLCFAFWSAAARCTAASRSPRVVEGGLLSRAAWSRSTKLPHPWELCAGTMRQADGARTLTRTLQGCPGCIPASLCLSSVPKYTVVQCSCMPAMRECARHEGANSKQAGAVRLLDLPWAGLGHLRSAARTAGMGRPPVSSGIRHFTCTPPACRPHSLPDPYFFSKRLHHRSVGR